MTKDLEEYYENIEYLDKEIAKYEDKEGNMFFVNPSNLLVAVQYQTLNKQEYEQAVFKGLVPKDIICKEIEIDKLVPKSEITHKDSDKTTITTIKQKAKEVWFVSNGLGMTKAYNNQEQAKEIANKINKEIFKVSGINVFI